jgi:hypothetical protein
MKIRITHKNGVPYKIWRTIFDTCMLLFVLVVGPISTAAMKAYCTLPPNEFRHSSPKALHTKRRERPLLVKDGTATKEFS